MKRKVFWLAPVMVLAATGLLAEFTKTPVYVANSSDKTCDVRTRMPGFHLAVAPGEVRQGIVFFPKIQRLTVTLSGREILSGSSLGQTPCVRRDGALFMMVRGTGELFKEENR